MSCRKVAGRCADHIRLKGHTKSTLASKHDKRGARDSLVPRPTSTWGVITYAYASGARPQETRGEDLVTAGEGGEGFVFWCVSMEIECREPRRLTVKL